jgi:ubiquinone/menaquinone biosynthesis C-methylase UbiE
MHAMPYADSSWDAAVMGWVLTYSTEPTRAAKEVVRVVKRGGLVAIGITVVSENQLDELKHENRLIASTAQILNVDDVLALFGEYVENIYFRHDRTDLTRQGHCLVIFSIKK